MANGALKVLHALQESAEKHGSAIEVASQPEPGDGSEATAGNGSLASAIKTGCQGFCAFGPLVQVEGGPLYVKVQPSDADDIVRAANSGAVVERLIYHENGRSYTYKAEVPFYIPQQRISLVDCGRIDPESIDEAIAYGRYQALAKALMEMTPDQVISTVEDSGLRGRGGAGFPTGRKWRVTRQQAEPVKYVICNADEGDPGAFMNGYLIEGDPHRLLEGVLIAAYAIGAKQAFIYVRAEYPLAVARLTKALADAEAEGLVGEHILATDFSCSIRLKLGAGAFVCGEETALMASIEERRGMPRPRPPFPAQAGLWGKPTVINNVETLSQVPGIIANGAEWFRQRGKQGNTGTKTFSITGKVAHTGLVEVPFGTTLRTLIFDIGGGIGSGKPFKAVQIGGPAGGCLPAEHLDLPIDYESLTAAGAIVGSGGLVVLDQSDCMVEAARYFMHFTQSESCGKCVPCREGTKRMLEILTRITEAKGTIEDIALLEELATTVREGSLCGLGKNAPNPVLTTLRYFRDEYLAHVRDHSCPAGVCKGFAKYTIQAENCTGCGRCARECPTKAISGERGQPYTIDESVCIHCGTCVEACKFGAIMEVIR